MGGRYTDEENFGKGRAFERLIEDFIDDFFQDDSLRVAEACPYSPGTLEKLAFLAMRYELGLPLWVSGDETKLEKGTAYVSARREHWRRVHGNDTSRNSQEAS